MHSVVFCRCKGSDNLSICQFVDLLIRERDVAHQLSFAYPSLIVRSLFAHCSI
ncbi:hypothetical protein HMPREF9074_09039 [Capnocytophaga sp. oral taxon 329 str. F0087]|nr:hypothetical protein HMPREF9074_09039 [Capnocytophaga sp. oral taxon 329 str. F0087]